MQTRALACVLVAMTAPAWADYEDYRDGRIRLAEPGVTLQRASEAGAEEAQANLPLLPGDRVWTDFSGRAEFQFADGGVIRLDTRSKLDYVAHDEGRAGDVSVVSLWSGSLYLHTLDRAASVFRIETPEGVVEVREGGVCRLDVARGELRLSVYEGEAVLESGRREERVGRGEVAYASRGEAPTRPEPFDVGDEDAFARWDREQGDPRVWAGDSRRYLPDEVLPYAADFEGHGDWHYEVEIGYVWRPRVASHWQPYHDGRWVWSAWGWTWVPYERWGWAPFHYGRWGHSTALGWYWIPGRSFGPAWVSWSIGGDYVGWCPLGHRNRPVDVGRGRGRAVPRGLGDPGASNAWTYARRERLGTREGGHVRTLPGAEPLRAMRLIDSERARLTRDLQAVDVDSSAAPRGAVPRHVRLRPSPGDSVPELRADPKTTIPDAAARRGIGRDDERWPRYRRNEDAVPAQDERAWPSATRRERRSQDDQARETPRQRQPAWSRAEDGREARERGRSVRPFEPARERREEQARDEARPRDRGDSERDVLRRFFRPLSGDERRADDDASARRGGDTPRESPRAGSDREPSSWRQRDDGERGRGRPERAEPRSRQPRSDAGASGRGDERGASTRRPRPRDRD